MGHVFNVPAMGKALKTYPTAMDSDRGRLVIVSGPSGAGKTTVVKRLLAECPVRIVLSISATTRRPRPGEREGVEYFFLTTDEFVRRREAGEFLENAEFSGNYYGTPKAQVEHRLAAGEWVLLEIEVQGMISVVQQYPDAVTIFVAPRDMEELERRLRGRGTESEETIQQRLEVARAEWSAADRYQYQVTNNSVDQSVAEICRVLLHEASAVES